MKLETERLILRDFVAEDKAAYAALRDGQEFKRFYSEEDVTQSKSSQLLDMFITDSEKRPRTNYQVAIATKKGDLIGSCGLRIEGDRQTSMGCELGTSWQSSGYAIEALREVIEFGFRELDIHRVYAETISENTAAITLCRKLGMRVEGEYVENRFFQNRWWNTTILGILKREWMGESQVF